MDKQDYFLKKYGIVLDLTATPEAQNQQMKIGFGVKDIDIGDRPYIFISYSHKDSAIVFPAIKALQEKGYPVWYDDSIRTGIAWRTHIAERVRDSAMVIAFMSKNSVVSDNCNAEIDLAINLKKPILTVRLDQSEISLGLAMYLNRDQMFSAYLYNGEDYIARLAAEPFIKETAGAALDAYNAEKRRVAEEAERKRREAEEKEAERMRLIASELEARQRRKEELSSKRRALEETERRRREDTEAEFKRLDEEEAELDRWFEETNRGSSAPLIPEIKYKETVATLEKAVAALTEERTRREAAEHRLAELEKHDESELENANRDMRVELWQRERREGFAWIILMAILLLQTHFLLIKAVYSSDMTVLLKALVYVVPMIVVVNVGSVVASIIYKDYIISITCINFAVGTFICCLVLCIGADFFILPEPEVAQRVLISIVYNGASAIISASLFALESWLCII